MATTKATKVNHTANMEKAMGMTFNALNKLRAHGCELRAVQPTRYFTTEMATTLAGIKAQIDAAHAACAAYREANDIDSHNQPRRH